MFELTRGTMTKPSSSRRRWLIPLVLVALAVITTSSLATYVYFFYEGSSTTVAPGQAHLLTDRVSNFFCKGEKLLLVSGDSSLRFDASVIPGKKLNDRVPQRDVINASSTINGDNGYVFSPFYVPVGAQIYVQQCTTSISSDSVISAIVKGKDVDEDCVKHVWMKYFSSDEEDDGQCAGSCPGFLGKPRLVQRCAGSKQRVSAEVKESGYYSILYVNGDRKPVQVMADVSISRLTYDLRSSLANCSSARMCVLPLRILSSDTIVATVSMTTKETSVAVKWSCVHQSAIFAVVFGAVPLLIIVLIVIIVSCRRKRKRQHVISSLDAASTEDSHSGNERTPLLHNADTRPNETVSYGTSVPEVPDPVLSKVGPIPGPYLYRPTAPPSLSPDIPHPDPHEEERPTEFHREPPPTYEETMKTTQS